MSDFFHSCQVLVSQIFWHMIMNASIIASPPCLISSAGTLSTSGDFCIFSIRIASSSSARRMGISAFSCVRVPRMLSSVFSSRVLCSTRSISQVLPFLVRRVPFLSSMFDDQLDLFLVSAVKME